MRVSLVLMLAMWGCVKATPFYAPELPLYSPAGAMSLVGKRGFGHACPAIGPDGGLRILTAAHVAFEEKGEARTYAWVDSYGSEGYVSAEYLDAARDLGTLELVSGTPTPFPVAQGATVGEEVHWFEYDFRTGAGVLSERLRIAHVSRVIAGHIIFDEKPVSGASGGCLLSAQNEILGIVVWDLIAENGEAGGVAVGVYGYR